MITRLAALVAAEVPSPLPSALLVPMSAIEVKITVPPVILNGPVKELTPVRVLVPAPPFETEIVPAPPRVAPTLSLIDPLNRPPVPVLPKRKIDCEAPVLVTVPAPLKALNPPEVAVADATLNPPKSRLVF